MELSKENKSWYEMSNDDKKWFLILVSLKYLYPIFAIFLCIYGYYFIYSTYSNEIQKRLVNFNAVSTKWNNSYYLKFMSKEISLSNANDEKLYFERKFERLIDINSGQIFYKPLFYKIEMFNQFFDNINLTKTVNEKSEFNISTPGLLQIKNLNSTFFINLSLNVFSRDLKDFNNEQCDKSGLLWDDDFNRCFSYSILKRICLIIDQDKIEGKSRNLSIDFEKFDCEDEENTYESFGRLGWQLPNVDPAYEDLKKIEIFVFSNYDPYVWSKLNKTFDILNSTEHEYVAAFWLVISSITLLVIPVYIYLKNLPEFKSVKKNFEKILELQDINNDFDKKSDKSTFLQREPRKKAEKILTKFQD